MAKTGKRLPSALGVSIAIHASLLAVLLFLVGLHPEELASKAPPIRTDLVYLQHSGPGGGGGGNPAPAPPKPMQIPPHDSPAIPAMVVTAPIEPPKPLIDASVQTSMATMLQASGTNLQAPPGPGGGGRGSGAGPGAGPGVGPGNGGNQGGGPRRLGDGVTAPVLIKEVKPNYTNAAVLARLSGSAVVEAVVLADGSVGDVKIVGSLDKVYGLDLEALKAARQWKFKPGTFEGKAVDVIVRIILDFNLRWTSGTSGTIDREPDASAIGSSRVSVWAREARSARSRSRPAVRRRARNGCDVRVGHGGRGAAPFRERRSPGHDRV